MKLIFFGAGFCSKFILESLEGFDEIICTHNLELTSQPFDEKLKIKRMTFSDFSKNRNDFFSGVTHLLNSIPPVKEKDIVFDLLKKTENTKNILQGLKRHGLKRDEEPKKQSDRNSIHKTYNKKL